MAHAAVLPGLFAGLKTLNLGERNSLVLAPVHPQRARREEEREFYLRMTAQQAWRVREVARQIDSDLFERALLHPPEVSTALREMQPQAAQHFKDACLLDFLTLPDPHSEAELHRSLMMKKPHENPTIGTPGATAAVALRLPIFTAAPRLGRKPARRHCGGADIKRAGRATGGTEGQQTPTTDSMQAGSRLGLNRLAPVQRGRIKQQRVPCPHCNRRGT